jgi:hypothetical protein
LVKRAYPAIIIAYIFPGNTYPIVENPQTPNSFAGKAVMKGYNSHYVITNKKGEALSPMDDDSIDYFDEIGMVHCIYILF